jgi:hypothetical protein
MEASEMFLFMWAGIATAVALYYQSKYKQASLRYENTGNLLCDVVIGDAKTHKDNEGFWVVENSNIRIKFKRQEREV